MDQPQWKYLIFCVEHNTWHIGLSKTENLEIQRNKIMLTNLTVSITVRLVEPRVNERILLPVGTDFCSYLFSCNLKPCSFI